MATNIDVKYSVVIPTYNRAGCILRAVRSANPHNREDVEVIVIDDGSTDETHELLNQCKVTGLRYVYQDNAGVSAARNHGMSLARGEWICFLDSDDEWLDCKLDVLDEAIRTSPDAKFLCSECFFEVSGELKHGYKELKAYELNHDFNIAPSAFELVLTRGVWTPSVVLLNSFVKDHGVEFDTRISMFEDMKLWAAIAAHTQILVIYEPLVLIHDDFQESIGLTQAGRKNTQSQSTLETIYRDALINLSKKGECPAWLYRLYFGTAMKNLSLVPNLIARLRRVNALCSSYWTPRVLVQLGLAVLTPRLYQRISSARDAGRTSFTRQIN